MKLVIPLEELVALGKDPSPDRVERLILSSPSLADVIGAAGFEEEKPPLRDQALDFLLESYDTWHSTAAVRDACDLPAAPTLLKELNALRDRGRVERRRGSGSGWEWKAA